MLDAREHILEERVEEAAVRVAQLALLEKVARAAIRTHSAPHGTRRHADALVERALEAADGPFEMLRERLTKRQEAVARVGGDGVDRDDRAVGGVREGGARVLCSATAERRTSKAFLAAREKQIESEGGG